MSGFNTVFFQLYETEKKKPKKERRSKKELCDKLGISEKTFYNWINTEKKYNPSDEIIKKVAEVFNVSYHEIKKGIAQEEYNLSIPKEFDKQIQAIDYKNHMIERINEDIIFVISTMLGRRFIGNEQVELSNGYHDPETDELLAETTTVKELVSEKLLELLIYVTNEIDGSRTYESVYSDGEILKLSEMAIGKEKRRYERELMIRKSGIPVEPYLSVMAEEYNTIDYADLTDEEFITSLESFVKGYRSNDMPDIPDIIPGKEE